MTRWRIAALGVSLLCTAGSGLSVLAARADDVPGAAFYGYTLLGQASGVELVEDRPTANSHPEADGEVPLSRVSLLSGPLGYALGTVAWPSALAANAGDLAVFAGNGNVPAQLGPPLDEPVRAETRTGAAPEVTNDSYPGASMHALVRPAFVAADAVLDGGQAGDATGLGSTETHGTATVGSSTVTATARSSTRDVSLAGGQVRIASVVSQATAVSNGTAATASGTTTVTGMTVAGVPVTVDGTGIHVAGQGSAVDTAAVDAVLANVGMRVVLSGPTQTRQGATVSYDSGSLVLTWNPSPEESLTARVGGARVTAAAFLADPASQGGAGSLPPPVAGPAAAAGGPAAPGGGVVPVISSGQPPPSAATPGPVLAASAPRSPSVLLAAESAPRGAVLLAVLGALALLVALLRFPAAVQAAASGPTCPPRSP